MHPIGTTTSGALHPFANTGELFWRALHDVWSSEWWDLQLIVATVQALIKCYNLGSRVHSIASVDGWVSSNVGIMHFVDVFRIPQNAHPFENAIADLANLYDPGHFVGFMSNFRKLFQVFDEADFGVRVGVFFLQW